MAVPDTLFDGSQDAPGAQLSPDGAWLVLRVGLNGGASLHISALRMDSQSAAPAMIVGGEYDAVQPILSPDGRLLAYSSNQSGRWEVFVRAFPDVDTDGIQVSTAGGSQPQWSQDGRELFFVSEAREMMVAEIAATSGLRVAGRQRLFPIPAGYFGIPNTRSTNYDVSADGQRFLMARAVTDTVEARPSLGVIVVQNWVEELRELLGG
jgi:dipeptidyl aminopeptidase/acylaminoacyl peptidase